MDEDRMMEWRNPTKLPNGDFDCEVDLPGYGWVPYTASTSDSISAGLHAEIDASGFVPPAPAQVVFAAPRVLSRRLFCHACIREGVLNDNEAEIAAQGGWPASFISVLNQLPPEMQVTARIDWPAVREIAEDNEIFRQVALVYAGTEQDRDDIINRIFTEQNGA